MRKLQKLISDKLDEGKSLRQIAHESGVEYTSVSNYYHRNVEPRGKNLGLLATYFRVPFADLLDDYILEDDRISNAKRLMLDELRSASDDAILEALLVLRKHESRR